MSTTRDVVALTRTSATVTGAPTLLFIHGFLDDETVWDGVIATLEDKVNTVRYDLPGFGARALSVADPDELSLDSLAAEAREIVRGVDTPVIVVGQSMGTQVAELVAANSADRVVGLVLLTPVPLGGTHLSEEEIAPFRTIADDVQAQRSARSQLSPRLNELQLDRLVEAGARTLPGVAARYVDVWNDGIDDAPPVSAYTGPTLVIRGGADAFVNAQLLGTIVSRFPDARQELIDEGGHWVHVEYPDDVAASILDFCEATVGGKQASGWQRGFTDHSPSAFAEEFADNVVLEGSTLAKPIIGKQQVAAVLATASSIYESLEFTARGSRHVDDVLAMAGNSIRWDGDQGRDRARARRRRQDRGRRHSSSFLGRSPAVLGRDPRSSRRCHRR